MEAKRDIELGLLVVYLAEPRFLPLLNTHLERIVLHTKTPRIIEATKDYQATHPKKPRQQEAKVDTTND